jgi:putative ABC transport system permease protein
MSDWFGCLAVAFRSLRKAPGFTLSSVLILASGLALCCYMFAAINAYVLRPLPFREAERLVHLELADEDDDSIEVPAADFLEWRRHSKTLEQLGAFYSGTINLSGSEGPERYDGAFVTSAVFSALGVQPILGRLFRAEDEALGAPAVVVLSHTTWRDRYGSDATVVGKPVRVNGLEAVIVGVMPENFSFPLNQRVWVPLAFDPAKLGGSDEPSVEVLGRLRPGASMGAARAEVTALVAQLATTTVAKPARRAVVQPLAHEYVDSETRALLFTMFGAVFLVLLIACANVANMILARSAGRSREFAIRAALGASRKRLALHLALETVWLSVVAAVLGFALAEQGVRWTDAALRAHGGEMLGAYWVHLAVDWRDLAFLTVATTLVTLLAGLLPALRALAGDLTAPIKAGSVSGGGRRGHLSRGLVAGEIALCTVLLTGTGLMVRSLSKIGDADLGARTDGILSGRVALFQQAYPRPEDRARWFENLEARAAAIPGVTAATISTSLPGTFGGGQYFLAEGTPPPEKGREPGAGFAAVTPNFFSLFEIPMLRGRTFLPTDRSGSQPVAIVNRRFADSVWPGEEAVGKRLRLGRGDDAEADWRTVIGVVRDVTHGEVDEGQRRGIYVPLAQSDVRFASVALRTSAPAMTLAEPLRRTVAALDPDVPVYFLRTLDEWLALGRFDNDFLALLFVLFGAVGALLAAAGLYAVVAYSVSRKTREIGVRRALGAQDQGILRWVLGQGFSQAAIGIGIGLPAALGFGQLLSNELFEVSPFDPLTFAGAIILVVLVAAAATWLPARRALGVAPNQALRYE